MTPKAGIFCDVGKCGRESRWEQFDQQMASKPSNRFWLFPPLFHVKAVAPCVADKYMGVITVTTSVIKQSECYCLNIYTLTKEWGVQIVAELLLFFNPPAFQIMRFSPYFPPSGFVQSGMTGDGIEESRDSRGGVKRRRKISLWPAVWYDTRYLKWAIWRKEDVAYHNRCWLHKTGQFEGHTHT